MFRGRRSFAGSVAVTLLLAAAVTGCTPAPAPSPTPTGFASEEEAFAAAEATYRAYVDALNQVDLSDPATFEPVYQWLSGAALSAAQKSFSQMHADGWVVSGDSEIMLVEPQTISEGFADAMLAVCVDVSEVIVRDSAGNSLIDDRPDLQSLTVDLAPLVADGSWRIDQFSSRSDGPEC